MSALALACLPAFGAAMVFLGMVLAVSAAVRAGDCRPWAADALAACVTFALASLAFLPFGA